MFLWKAVLTAEEILSFALLHTSNTLDELDRTFEEYEEARRRINFGNEGFKLVKSPRHSRGGKDVRCGADTVLHDHMAQIRQGEEDKVDRQVDALAAEQGKVSLITKRLENTGEAVPAIFAAKWVPIDART